MNAKYGNSGENNIQQVQVEVHAEDVESNGGKSSLELNEEHVTIDSIKCSVYTGVNLDSNVSKSPIKCKECASTSTDCSDGSAVNPTGQSMSGLNLANSVNNLNGTDENNEHGKVNGSKDGSGREGVKKEPGDLGKKVTPSRSKNHDSVKSVEESTSPLGTSKEHEKNAADNGENVV